MRQVITKDFTDGDRDFTAEVAVEFHVEKNWGADADGNRGISRLFIDDAEILGVLDEDGNTVAVVDGMLEMIQILPEDLLVP